ncbi:GNAT family N-acetyltransferase [Streptomyces sp. YC504]|uniref:GNAT family N-acetyltransferase n=1 Tax=Streptomyces mesophilus TaxID=1775132 RepID=A0A6G4XWL7_9ACTN|nr:GNAT family N-acetyltransferase [Streptomyces mesophilus]NGO81084.1 GNAT family N-acetyltransferase [Streptomyces mesophilus]
MKTVTVRPATLDDAAAAGELLNQVDVVEGGKAETDVDEILAEWKHPEVDLTRDSWLLHEDGKLVGYGLLWDESGGERIDVDLYMLPGRPDGARLLLDRMEARAAERAAENGVGRAVIHQGLHVTTAVDQDVLRERGWRTVRRYHVMHRAISPAADTMPEPLPGLCLRPCTDEADRRQAHALLQESFRGHFDFQPRTYEQWLHDIDAENADFSLIWIARLEGMGDIAAMRTRNDRLTTGWISNLGVLAEARGRGIAGYLLRYAFWYYAGLGRDRVSLGVDTDNSSGALALYERHGMSLDVAVDTWELTRPV